MPLSETTALILAGGLGTRLRPVVADRPKVLAGIGPGAAARPFVTYLLEQIARAGLRRAVICTGYQAEQVYATLGEAWGPLELIYSPEPEPLGTAGALRQALAHLAGATALALNGDSYCQADLAAFWKWHHERGARGSLVLTRVPDTRRFGRVVTEPEGRVLRFEEKAPAGEANAQGNTAGHINAGIYLLSRELLEQIPAGRAVSLEREMFPAWIGQGLYGWPGGGRFIDIGTPESFAAGQDFFDDLTQPASTKDDDGPFPHA